MNKDASVKRRAISDRFIRLILGRLENAKQVRRTLPGQGRLHIDRPLPFLCVYRRPPRRADVGTDRLVTSEASYLIAPGEARARSAVASLVHEVARTLGTQFGAFLVLEVWSSAEETPNHLEDLTPRFRVFTRKGDDPGSVADTLEEALSRVKLRRRAAEVELVQAARVSPDRCDPLLSAQAAKKLRCSVLGLEVRPVYRDPANGTPYPIVLREIRRGLSRALKRTFYEFTRTRTTHRPRHYHVLGRHAMVKAVWEVDTQLADVSDSFDFLLQLTPVNTGAAWEEFRKNRFQRAPVFHYRPLPVDPSILKRRLYAAPVERVEDPALTHLFREKQDELDRQITLLLDMNTSRFVHGSLQLFGTVSDELLGLGEDLLESLPPRTREDSRSGYLDAATFARRAEEEIASYRRQWPQLNATVHVRGDVNSGLMVSRGSLLIGTETRIPASRADALLQHEVGTHIVTYFNGRAQPFRQLYTGLAGYEALQEGLAVLAEYLVGGLSRPRLRLLAARVLAARHLVDGASFVETFSELHRIHEFDRRTAFTVAMRIYRGGGLTKDAIYLRGLREVLAYVARGGKLEPLFVGKIATEHIPIVSELHWRGVLREAPLTPRYFERPDARRRLEQLRNGITVLQLAKGRRR